jgi:hypothetical protein
VDALRGVLIGSTHFGVLLDLLALAGAAAVLMVLGAYRFSKIEV